MAEHTKEALLREILRVSQEKFGYTSHEELNTKFPQLSKYLFKWTLGLANEKSDIKRDILQSDMQNLKRLQLPGGTSNQEPSATKEFNDGMFFQGELKSVKAKLAKLEDEMKMAEVEFRRKANSDPCWSAKADELKAKVTLVSDCLTEVRGLLSIGLDIKGTNEKALIDLRKGVEDAANHEKAARAVMKGIKALLEA